MQIFLFKTLDNSKLKVEQSFLISIGPQIVSSSRVLFNFLEDVATVSYKQLVDSKISIFTKG